MQTSYRTDFVLGNEGAMADMSDSDIRTFNADAYIPFGHYVARKSGTDNFAKPPVTSAEITDLKNVAGIARENPSLESKNDGLKPGYSAGNLLPVVSAGRVIVRVEEAVTPDSDVFVRFAGKPQIQDLVFSAALITGNVTNGDVNGAAITPITYATSNAATLTAIAAAIQAHPDVETAVSDGTDTITVTGVTDKEVALTNFVVTGGASQATVSVTETQALTNTNLRGAFRASADSSTAAQLSSARYLKTAALGELTVVEIIKKV